MDNSKREKQGKAVAKNSDEQWTTVNNSEQQWTTVSNSEQQW